MTKSFSRRVFISGLLGTASTAAFANAPQTSLRPLARPEDSARRAAPEAQRLIDAAQLGNGKVGYVVADARTGEVLEAANPLLPLPPASVTKALTSLYALDRLGPTYTFPTKLMMSGDLRNGVLEGDLTLVGGGDPTLNTDVLGDMAKELKALGIREVKGAFNVQASALPYLRQIDGGQPDHLGYNPAISGLNLNFNRVHFEWKRQAGGYDVMMDARAERFRPRVAMARMLIVNRSTPVYTYSEDEGRDNWTVAKGALGNGGSRWLPVRRPDLYAAEVFQTLARSHGITLPTPSFVSSTPAGTLLMEHNSGSLQNIVRGMLKYSTNLTAEVVGLTASASDGRIPDGLIPSAVQMSGWLGDQYGLRHAAFVDHSGLGDGSRISASEMVRALQTVGPNGPLKPLLKDFRMRTSEGSPMRDQPIEIKAKTGTLNFVSTLAGYTRRAGGREMVFAIFCADTSRRAQISRAMRERPEGGRAWARRARTLQQRLIERWTAVHNA
ncbi:D-alanyl-D-alanine carboxypeptidase/D-alanyl-D-alanine-endopeptidase [Aliiroseovarius sp. YM-037]|uniref:D-alanyl-D-alanine carboxypeptidase/D-alanyl-D-alanine endopeptidase n=1 Tax=Aliiroseovarius sp. YM-037 TaxID=3341728 RepID=UPI003A804C14